MTANLVRWNPAGTNGAAVVTTGTPLSSVIISGSGTVLYDNTAGMARGSMGVKITGGGTADQANFLMPTTAAAAGAVQIYGIIDTFPTGGSQEFLTVRTAAGNCVRFLCSTAGSITMQNKAGSTVATLGTVSTGTVYRYELDAFPNTTNANGTGQGRIYDDSDTLLYDSTLLTGSYGGDLGTKTVSILRTGDPTTATTSGFVMRVTQPAIDTAATVPTISPVAILVNGSVTATVIAITLTSPAPSVEGATSVSGGGPIGISLVAVAPTVAGQQQPTTVAVAASAALAAVAPVATGSATVDVVAAAAQIVIGTGVPGVLLSASVAAVAAAVTVGVGAPVVTTATGSTVAAVAAAVTVGVPAPAVTGQQVASVSATVTAVTLVAVAPAVAGVQDVSVAAAATAVQLAAVAPAISAGTSVVAVGSSVTVAAVAPVAAGSASVVAVVATLALTARGSVQFSAAANVTAVRVLMTLAFVGTPIIRTVTPTTPRDRVWLVATRSRRFIVEGR